MFLELNLDPGPCGENTLIIFFLFFHFFQRFLVTGESFCSGNAASAVIPTSKSLMRYNLKNI